MPVKRRKPKVRIEGFPDWQIRFLETSELPPEDDPDMNVFELLDWQYHTAVREDPALLVWQACREQIMAKWLARHPGSRPYGWWAFDAPEPGRLQVGGTGTPAHEVLAYGPSYSKGIPTLWVTERQALYYNGLARDKHGNPMEMRKRDGTLSKPGDFAGVPPDPNDPPLFESESTYLDRHRLLTEGERAALNTADFEPVTLPPEYFQAA